MTPWDLWVKSYLYYLHPAHPILSTPMNTFAILIPCTAEELIQFLEMSVCELVILQLNAE
jgi:hypothetical protein